MPSLNEVKITALKAAGAVGKTINELEINWLRDIQGHTAKTLNGLWVQEFLAAGATAGEPWNGMAYEYLGLNGALQDTINERWYQFWADGGAAGTTLISDTNAVAALWTVRGTNTVTDNIPAGAVEIENVDDDGGCYLRLATTTILSEALVDGTNYRIGFTSKSAGTYYMGLASDTANRVMRAGLNVANFKPLGSTDLAASFLNISLPDGVGQIEVIEFIIRVWKL